MISRLFIFDACTPKLLPPLLCKKQKLVIMASATITISRRRRWREDFLKKRTPRLQPGSNLFEFYSSEAILLSSPQFFLPFQGYLRHQLRKYESGSLAEEEVQRG